MLNKPVDGFEFGPDGKVCGVRSGDEVAKAPMVICDPSYADPAKTKLLGQVVRTICILGAPIPDMLNKERPESRPNFVGASVASDRKTKHPDCILFSFIPHNEVLSSPSNVEVRQSSVTCISVTPHNSSPHGNTSHEKHHVC